MWILALVSCVMATPLVGQTTTDGGAWDLALESTSYDRGDAEIAISLVEASTGAPGEDLAIMLRPSMDDMGDIGQPVDLEETEPGLYAGTVTFDMPGIWELTGYVSDGTRVESYQLVVEVHP